MRVAVQAARFAAVLALGAGLAAAAPIITISYDPAANYTAADQSIVSAAVGFYTSNMTSNFSLSLVFGSQLGGGATSNTLNYTNLTYGGSTGYYSALVAASSGDATDVAALASLPNASGPLSPNPVTGTTGIVVSTTLAQTLGLVAGPQPTNAWATCGGQVANACITPSTDLLFGTGNLSGGTPQVALLGVLEHEIDEVLGTSSALSNGGVPGNALPTNPRPADLFRYSASTTRSFAYNASTAFPCTGTPTAYFSVDGGATNVQSYNNCANGGDYGDWFCADGSQVQCFAAPSTATAQLTLASPEVTVLDAVGYNFQQPAGVPEPSSILLLLTVLGAVPVLRKRSAKPRG